MNAAQATQLAADRWRNMNYAERNQYENVLSSIRQAINKHEVYDVNYHQKLPETVLRKLRDDGYTVNDVSDRDGVLIQISWPRAKTNNIDKNQ